MRNVLSIGLAAILLLCCAGIGQAVTTMTLVNENFDGMGTGTALPSGWTDGYLGAVGTQNRLVMSPLRRKRSGHHGHARLRDGSHRQGFQDELHGTLSDAGHVFNCGAQATNPASDRALGNYPRTNPSGDHIIQVAFTNNTDYPIDSINLDYDMEQWGWGQGTSGSGAELLRVLFSSTSATSGFTYMGSRL